MPLIISIAQPMRCHERRLLESHVQVSKCPLLMRADQNSDLLVTQLSGLRVSMPRIYTRTGDKGETGLFSGQRVPKDSLRIESYGTIDELSSSIGHARSFLEDKEIDKTLKRIQQDLFIVSADLATLCVERGQEKATQMRVTEDMIENLEQEIDRFDAQLSRLSAFIVPEGTKTATALHVARSVARRAERGTVALMHKEQVNPHTIAYLNRLSSLLFVLARIANKRSGTKETELTSRLD